MRREVSDRCSGVRKRRLRSAFKVAEAGRFFNSPVQASQSRQDHRILDDALGQTALSELFLQGPISAFIGTLGIATEYEDIPFAEKLGCGTG